MSFGNTYFTGHLLVTQMIECSKVVSKQTTTCSFFYMVIFPAFIEQLIFILFDIMLTLFVLGFLGFRNALQTHTITLSFRKSKNWISFFSNFGDISIYLPLDAWNMWRHRKILNGYNFLSKQHFFINLPLNETNSLFFHFRFANSIKLTYFGFFFFIIS